MRTKFTSLMIVALLMGTFLLAFAPTAEAQGRATSVTVKLEPATQNVKPLQGQISIKGTVTFTADPTVYNSLIGVPIQYSVKTAPSWASVTISPTSDVIVIQPGATQQVEATKTFDVIISANEQAPAFQAAPIEITAAAAATQATAAQTGTGSTPIVADYFSIIDVQLAEAIKVDRPQTPVIFPLTITNFGNANTKVSFEILSQDESLQVPQSKQAGGNQITATVPLTVQTPYKNGYMNEVGQVTFKITSAYALDSKLKGDESTVAVLVTTKGFYVPGFSPVFLVGLLALAAVLIRRRA
jgi:hypothetical protein